MTGAAAGWVKIVGLGPGADSLVTPEAQAVLAEATDVVGYIPYVARVADRPGLTKHPSDNRVELDRSQHEAVCAFLILVILPRHFTPTRSQSIQRQHRPCRSVVWVKLSRPIEKGYRFDAIAAHSL